MQFRRPLAFILVLVMAGCAHREHHYTVPNAAPMELAENRLATAVAHAHLSYNDEGVALRDEGQQIEAQKTKVDALLNLAPPELRLNVKEMQDNLKQLSDSHDALVAKHNELGNHLLEADKAKDDAAVERAKYEKQADDQTASANKENQAAVTWSKRAIWFGSHWILGVLAAVLGIGLLVFSWLVKAGIVAGKTAVKVASIIP